MSDQNPMVLLETSKGDITIELFQDKAPITVKNFLAYANSGFYEGTIFHRVIPGFMIQGGGYNWKLKEKVTGKSIRNEADNGVENLRGTVAMARTEEPDSASAQFFVNLADNDFLNHRGTAPADYGYAVFGKVVDGMDVVDAIAAVATKSAPPHDDVPVDPITIKGAIEA